MSDGLLLEPSCASGGRACCSACLHVRRAARRACGAAAGPVMACIRQGGFLLEALAGPVAAYILPMHRLPGMFWHLQSTLMACSSV